MYEWVRFRKLSDDLSVIGVEDNIFVSSEKHTQ